MCACSGFINDELCVCICTEENGQQGNNRQVASDNFVQYNLNVICGWHILVVEGEKVRTSRNDTIKRRGTLCYRKKSFSLSHERAGRKSAQQHKGRSFASKLCKSYAQRPLYRERSLHRIFQNFQTGKPGETWKPNGKNLRTYFYVIFHCQYRQNGVHNLKESKFDQHNRNNGRNNWLSIDKKSKRARRLTG